MFIKLLVMAQIYEKKAKGQDFNFQEIFKELLRQGIIK